VALAVGAPTLAEISARAKFTRYFMLEMARECETKFFIIPGERAQIFVSGAKSARRFCGSMRVSDAGDEEIDRDEKREGLKDPPLLGLARLRSWETV